MDLYKMSIWQLLLAGGWVMWPIILCSVFAFAVALEKIIYLNRVALDSRGLLDKILEKMKRHDTKEALQLCENAPGPIANILKAGVLKYDRPRQQITEAIEGASLYEIPRLEKNLAILSTVAYISPLLGLLGTVVGLLKCFQAIQAKAAVFQPVSPMDLSQGIWQALLTTIAGLIVAIPAYITYNYLSNRINNVILEMEKSSTELVNFLTE